MQNQRLAALLDKIKPAQKYLLPLLLLCNVLFIGLFAHAKYEIQGYQDVLAENERLSQQYLNAAADKTAAEEELQAVLEEKQALQTEADSAAAQYAEAQTKLKELEQQNQTLRAETEAAQNAASGGQAGTDASGASQYKDASGTADAASDGGGTVYVTKSGKKYHNASCRYASNSGVKQISRAEAAAKGYSACSICGG